MIKVGFAMTGSFCTFHQAIGQMQNLVDKGYDVYPIMSTISYETDTRFGLAEDYRCHVMEITGHQIIHTIVEAEPIGPKVLFDLLIIAPATGNTLAKLANGINDTPVTMAAKAHLRNARPLLLAVSTNDALSASAQNIGRLLNLRNIFFVPMKQDDLIKKPCSVVADFEKLPEAAELALAGRQLEPVYS